MKTASERRKCNEPDCEFPDCNCWDIKKRFSQQRVIKLERTLILVKDMMEINELDKQMPNTYETVLEAIGETAS